ncbi:transcriptional regulator, LysR family (plasmid) [Rhizobium leguminosarum bv. trifolii WSM2304]|uniref:Transcriptional regulator, LysR family n=2 Tax=Rhizobium leguminosarum TaxID=384 RepID=A0ABF7QZ66_RHILW|nr:transcriptional regulator, LysR family [Rhizobium leguminosarum bv. trifolii WSM2304]
MRLLVSRHLENFLAIYEARNMHRASGSKGITQPALTKSLKTLEDDIGSALFVRTPWGLEPTEAGQTLYRHACTIDQEARFASLNMNNVLAGRGGKIRIGVGPGLAVSSFPKILVDFRRRFPGVQVIAQTGLTSQLVEELLRDTLDVIATARPPRDLPEHFSRSPLFPIQMAAIARRGHPLLAPRTVRGEDLFEYGCVTFQESEDFVKQTRQLFGAAADKLNVVVETNSISVMLDMVASTDCFAFVGDIIVPRAIQAGLERLHLPDLRWEMIIDLMCKRSLAQTKPVRALREGWLHQSFV